MKPVVVRPEDFVRSTAHARWWHARYVRAMQRRLDVRMRVHHMNTIAKGESREPPPSLIFETHVGVAFAFAREAFPRLPIDWLLVCLVAETAELVAAYSEDAIREMGGRFRPGAEDEIDAYALDVVITALPSTCSTAGWTRQEAPEKLRECKRRSVHDLASAINSGEPFFVEPLALFGAMRTGVAPKPMPGDAALSLATLAEYQAIQSSRDSAWKTQTFRTALEVLAPGLRTEKSKLLADIAKLRVHCAEDLVANACTELVECRGLRPARLGRDEVLADAGLRRLRAKQKSVVFRDRPRGETGERFSPAANSPSPLLAAQYAELAEFVERLAEREGHGSELVHESARFVLAGAGFELAGGDAVAASARELASRFGVSEARVSQVIRKLKLRLAEILREAA